MRPWTGAVCAGWRLRPVCTVAITGRRVGCVMSAAVVVWTAMCQVTRPCFPRLADSFLFTAARTAAQRHGLVQVLSWLAAFWLGRSVGTFCGWSGEGGKCCTWPGSVHEVCLGRKRAPNVHPCSISFLGPCGMHVCKICNFWISQALSALTSPTSPLDVLDAQGRLRELLCGDEQGRRQGWPAEGPARDTGGAGDHTHAYSHAGLHKQRGAAASQASP
jgi:hypothetical protein